MELRMKRGRNVCAKFNKTWNSQCILYLMEKTIGIDLLSFGDFFFSRGPLRQMMHHKCPKFKPKLSLLISREGQRGKRAISDNSCGLHGKIWRKRSPTLFPHSITLFNFPLSAARCLFELCPDLTMDHYWCGNELPSIILDFVGTCLI